MNGCAAVSNAPAAVVGTFAWSTRARPLEPALSGVASVDTVGAELPPSSASMGREFPSQRDPVQFLPFYLETAARRGAAHELEVVGWSDNTLRRTVLRSVVPKLAGGIVQCRAEQSQTDFLRTLAPAYGQPWSGRSGDVYRRIRDTASSRVHMLLLEDAHHLTPRFFRLLQGLFHDTSSFCVLASGSEVLFQRLWRAARGNSLLVYCRLHVYGVRVPDPLVEYLQRQHAAIAPRLRDKPPPKLRLHNPD